MRGWAAYIKDVQLSPMRRVGLWMDWIRYFAVLETIAFLGTAACCVLVIWVAGIVADGDGDDKCV